MNTIKNIVESINESCSINSNHRKHLGASVIGDDCLRKLWYIFNHAYTTKINGKLSRIFSRGQEEEQRVENILKKSGYQVITTASHGENKGKQHSISSINGHFGGSLDGAVYGFDDIEEWHVLEIKTHNDKSFKDLQKKGVMLSHFNHYVQMQIYIHFTKMNHALYFAVNKNTDEIYVERVSYDENCALDMIDKAKMIIESTTAPKRISERKDWFKCKMCDFSKLCHGDDHADINCRTCVFSEASKNGTWHCKKFNKNADNVCDSHIYNPSFLDAHSNVVDCNESSYTYVHRYNGQKYINGDGGLSSQQLKNIPPRFINDLNIHKLVKDFDIESVEYIEKD